MKYQGMNILIYLVNYYWMKKQNVDTGDKFILKNFLKWWYCCTRKRFIWYLSIQLYRRFINIDKAVYVCFVYIPPRPSSYFKINDESVFKVIDKSVQKNAELGYISLIVDLNARCGQLIDYFQEHEDMFKHADFNNSIWLIFLKGFQCTK